MQAYRPAAATVKRHLHVASHSRDAMKLTPPSLRSGCPIATSLDVFGDRWTLVIVRDLLNGKRRYADLAGSPERIPTNILAARLKAMVAAGLVTRERYQERPARHQYQLTARGAGLLPVLQALCRWANREYPATWRPPDAFLRRRPRRAA